MSSILERLGMFLSSFQQRYEEYNRPRIPLNLFGSKEPTHVKKEPSLPDVETPKLPVESQNITELFRP